MSYGHPLENASNSEIIDLKCVDENDVRRQPSCRDFENPFGNHGLAGGLVSGGSPLVCGGVSDSRFCYIIGSQGVKAKLIEARFGAASVVINNGKTLWITGGQSLQNHGSLLKTSELITLGFATDKGPELPRPMSEHCMVAINSTTIMIVGGTLEGSTYFYNLRQRYWVPGPQLAIPRYRHSCSIMRTKSQTDDPLVVVAGGRGRNRKLLSSVEVLLIRDSQDWIKGIK